MRVLLRAGLAAACLAAVSSSAPATTLIRASVDDLVATNRIALIADVVDANARWNDDGTFILTDVTLIPRDVLAGDKVGGELVVTVMGGTVGELTTLILGGAELVPGRSYVVFADRADLPGASGVLTVPDHCQGVFEIVERGGALRAVSQANGHPLLPDKSGTLDAPGGLEGFPLHALAASVRDLAASRGVRREVRP